ncbi:MAG: aldo/keto reductase [Proteobacteria bacterium]|nr:aldo/keto reductase [Pseudomonadota bacterium]
MQYMTLAGVASQALIRTGNARAAFFEAKETAGLAEPWPDMAYSKLGRTDYNGSRLIFGCGAALSSKRRDELLNTAFDAGVNVFDIGYRSYYDDAEKNLAPFLKQRRDEIFLISKAVVPVDLNFDEVLDVSTSKKAAAGWLKLLEGSLSELQVDHVDAYYLMASNNVSVITNEEIYGAFEKAKAAGKVSHLGLSTHQNAENVLKAAIDTGWYSLATIAITPAGWYDWIDRTILEGTPPMKDLQPLLAKAREAGIGLVGMKAGRFLAGRRFLGWGNPAAFDEFYNENLMQSRLSEFQRSYAFVLAHGLDAVNADMQNMVHLKENFVAAATSHNYFNVA